VLDQAQYNCQSCGACCVQLGPYDGNSYVYLDKEEAGQMRALGLPIVEAAMGGGCLAAVPKEGAGGRPACVAFAGGLGGPCGCSVYEDRPSVCREFEVGGQLCQEARELAGLPA
jgi:Fe-S-cluster containining protein